MTNKELNNLKKEYPEGIPTWMLERNHTVEEVRELMELRRAAFPKTKEGR